MTSPSNFMTYGGSYTSVLLILLGVSLTHVVLVQYIIFTLSHTIFMFKTVQNKINSNSDSCARLPTVSARLPYWIPLSRAQVQPGQLLQTVSSVFIIEVVILPTVVTEIIWV